MHRNTYGAAYQPAIESALHAGPQQAWEFMTDRWLVSPDHRVLRRIADPDDPEHQCTHHLLKAIASQYSDLATLADQRNAGRLIRLVMRGEQVNVDGEQFRLDLRQRTRLLLAGLLYTLRNDRVHGSMPSPFTSSAATLKTYTLPHYAFAVTYFLFLVTAVERGHVQISAQTLTRNLQANLSIAQSVMDRHWQG